MRNDTDRWAPPSDFAEGFEADGLRIAVAPTTRLTMISGPRVLLQTPLPQIGWPDICKFDRYALVLRRDRVLEVNGDARPDGWDEAENLAVSEITDGSVVFHLEGEKSFALLSHGAELNLNVPSRSVERLMFGQMVLLHCRASKTGFAVHVESQFAQAFWAMLLSNARAI